VPMRASGLDAGAAGGVAPSMLVDQAKGLLPARPRQRVGEMRLAAVRRSNARLAMVTAPSRSRVEAVESPGNAPFQGREPRGALR